MTFPASETAPIRPLQWTDLAEDRLRLDQLCFNVVSGLSSPAGKGRHSSRLVKKVLHRHPSLHFGPAGEAPVVSGLPIAIEAAMGGLEGKIKETKMATIGTFKITAHNEFTGEIVTLSVQAKNVRIVPETRATGDNAPSHRVFVGKAEIGAAWSKKSNEGRDYLGLKLDDPSFSNPIYANLFADEDGKGHSLIWSRPTRRGGE